MRTFFCFSRLTPSGKATFSAYETAAPLPGQRLLTMCVERLKRQGTMGWVVFGASDADVRRSQREAFNRACQAQQLKVA